MPVPPPTYVMLRLIIDSKNSAIPPYQVIPLIPNATLFMFERGIGLSFNNIDRYMKVIGMDEWTKEDLDQLTLAISKKRRKR